MKKIYIPFLLAALFLTQHVLSQNTCATMEIYDKHVQKNPALPLIREQMEKAAGEGRSENTKKNSPLLLTIPVVFHVVYNIDSPQQNIPDSVLLSQIEVLNEDFRRLNPDTDAVRSVFDSLAADINIEFCLADIDPDGNTTAGITRTSNTIPSFDFFNNQQEDMKFNSKGGKDAWPRDKYLNIWTCYMTIFNSPGVLGYSHFPWDTTAATDGVVLLYNAVGRNNKVFDMAEGNGKTATHEVGHWLGLFHTWGNESWFTSGCDSIDYVDDTPNQKDQSNFDCNKSINSCSVETASFWGSQNPPDMVENYMDYSADSCMCMFTKGQRDRMQSYLNTSRLNLFSSTACSQSSSVGMIKNNPHFTIFPNPSQGKISISHPGNTNFNVQIYNLFGQKLFEDTNCHNNKLISLVDFHAGYYFVRVGSEKNESFLPLVISGK